jgi:hypothetical protein
MFLCQNYHFFCLWRLNSRKYPDIVMIVTNWNVNFQAAIMPDTLRTRVYTFVAEATKIWSVSWFCLELAVGVGCHDVLHSRCAMQKTRVSSST